MPRTLLTMAVTARDGLFDYMAEHGGACRLQLIGADDPERALAGMQAAARAVGRLPHPDEPTEPLPNWISGVALDDDGPAFTIDVKDSFRIRAIAERVVAGTLNALADEGIDQGVLTWPADVEWPTSMQRSVSSRLGINPDGVCPVLLRVGEGIAEHLAHRRPARAEERQRAIGEHVTGATVGREEERRRRILDWYVRAAVPQFVGRAGFEREAQELRALSPLVESFDPLRACETLLATYLVLTGSTDSTLGPVRGRRADRLSQLLRLREVVRGALDVGYFRGGVQVLAHLNAPWWNNADLQSIGGPGAAAVWVIQVEGAVEFAWSPAWYDAARDLGILEFDDVSPLVEDRFPSSRQVINVIGPQIAQGVREPSFDWRAGLDTALAGFEPWRHLMTALDRGGGATTSTRFANALEEGIEHRIGTVNGAALPRGVCQLATQVDEVAQVLAGLDAWTRNLASGGTATHAEVGATEELREFEATQFEELERLLVDLATERRDAG